jgi:hypothetical protein
MSMPSPLPSPWRTRSLAAGLGLAFAVVGLGGCTHLNVPTADAYPASSQHKARAVHHWDLLAEDVATRIAAKAKDGGMFTQVFHLVPAERTPFNRAFGDLLLTRLVNQGMVIASAPNPGHDAGAYIRYDAQVVAHGSSRRNSTELPITSLAVGVAVLRDSWLHIPSTASGVLAGVSAGLVADVSSRVMSGSASGGPTRTELLVSTSMELGQRFVTRTSDIYYIEPDDVGLFVPPPPPPPPPPPEPPAPVKNWRVVGS